MQPQSQLLRIRLRWRGRNHNRAPLPSLWSALAHEMKCRNQSQDGQDVYGKTHARMEAASRRLRNPE